MIVDVEPMLAMTGMPAGELDGWAVEPKLDGSRVRVLVDGGLTVRSRRGRKLTPALLPQLGALAGSGAHVLLDGELVAGAGRSDDFYGLAPRMMTNHRPERLTLTLFDVLWHDGELLVSRPYEERRGVLERLDLPGVVVLPRWPGTEALALLEACTSLDVEGIVLKQRRSIYRAGRRSSSWRTMRRHPYRCHRRRGHMTIHD